MKKIQSVDNRSNGFDLSISDNEGNFVIIPTGNPKNSLKFWKRLELVCSNTIAEIELADENHPLHRKAK